MHVKATSFFRGLSACYSLTNTLLAMNAVVLEMPNMFHRNQRNCKVFSKQILSHRIIFILCLRVWHHSLIQNLKTQL